MDKQTIIDKAKGYSPLGAEVQAFIDGAEWVLKQLELGDLYEVKWQHAEGKFGVIENVGYVIADDETAVDRKFGHLVGYKCRFKGSKVYLLNGDDAAGLPPDGTEIKKLT